MDTETKRTVPFAVHVERRLAAVNPALVATVLLFWALAIYFRTTASMVAIWERSETFAHGFAVIPIFLYLLWRDRDRLGAMRPSPVPMALAGIVVAGMLWVLGERLHLAALSQLAMVSMVPLGLWAIMGTQVVATLAYPIVILFFAVPFGEFLLPVLIDRTADFVEIALRASGVPVFREGNFLNIPSGRWSVVEACSGLRYLIASLLVGLVYAYLSYRSPRLRAYFILASLVVPIVANWLRAYLIVMLGHLTENRLATGVDHIIYGWIFFGIVMLALFWIGSRWREDLLPEKPASAIAVRAPGEGGESRMSVLTAAFATFVLIAVWLPLGTVRGDTSNRDLTLIPVADAAGWAGKNVPLNAWRPDVESPRAESRQTFVKGGETVGLYLALFVDQPSGKKGLTTRNQIVRTSNLRATYAASGEVVADVTGNPMPLEVGIVTAGGERMLATRWFWAGGRMTSNIYVAIAYQAMAIVRGRSDAVGWIVAYVPGADDAAARTALQSFASAMSGAIAQSLAQSVEDAP